MLLLILFAFLAGIVTILSPCILPVLPIVLSSSVTGGKSRPLGIVTGFIFSFTFFTLFLSAIVQATGISADWLRNLSVIIIFTFGLSLLIPQFQLLMEKSFSKLSNLVPTQKTETNSGFGSGLLVGLSLGLLWTPCVGPILASVIALTFSGTITSQTFLITFAYAVGTAIPMFIILLSGRAIFQKVPWLLSKLSVIQKIFGVIMILTSLAIFFNLDRQFQSWVLTKFPQYGTGLTSFEQNKAVQEQLNQIQRAPQIMTGGPKIIAGGEWFNSAPLTLEQLKGKVVLIDFWTYTCINCIRTLPYLRSWQQKYADKGLVIIGVHTPEFEFEKNPQNLQKAINDFDLKYPIVQDNNYATWNAFGNQYWPAKYLFDKNGQISYSHFGEGEYDKTEQKIQDLLKETGATVTDKIANPTYTVETKTPETYLGYSRMVGLASPEKVTSDKVQIYSQPVTLTKNQFALSGSWAIYSEYANPQKDASLTFQFDASKVFLVLQPKTTSCLMQVFLDGQVVPADMAGEDVKKGLVTIDSDRLYKLISLPKEEEHTLKLKFLDNDCQAYAFTFG